MNKKYNDSEILELHNKGLTDSEIAKVIGCTSNQMAKKRKRMGLKPNNPIIDYNLTDREISILIGTLLGDSCVRYVHDKCKYPMLSFSHCYKQFEYFLFKKNQLENLMSSYNVYTKVPSKSNKFQNGPYQTCQYNGKNMKCLIPIRDAFYINNIKTIPMELIEKYFTEESIYYWFMDDGCYDKSNNSYKISTECLKKEDLEKLIIFLFEKFNLSFSIKKDGELYLKHKSNEIFRNILLKYNRCDTMQYKIG